jgi:hypothetical protein
VKMAVVRLEVEFLLSFIPHSVSLVVLQAHKHPLQVGHRVERSPLTTAKQLAKQQRKGCIYELRKNIRRMRHEIMHRSGVETSGTVCLYVSR